MQTLQIEANHRSDMSKSRTKQLRREGYVTASISGRGKDPVSIEVKLADLANQMKGSEGGTTSLIDLHVNGGPADSGGMVIMKNFYKDPLSHKVIDVVFQRVIMTEVIHVAVPVELEGEAPGVASGGNMEQMIYELNISCLPGIIPAKIAVDISHMEIGDIIRVQDMDLGEGIESLVDPDTMICMCRSSAAAPAEEAAVAEEVAEEA